jgi:hypothetical protein
VIQTADLLLPIASIAKAGGPMKVIPASVHFFAKCGFSLSYVLLANYGKQLLSGGSYKSISRVYALATLILSNLNYPVSVEICGRVAEVDGKRGAKSML